MKLRCRLVQPDDIKLIFDWVNDPLVRQNSFCQNEILYKEHETWFQNVLDSDHCELYVVLVDEKPAGQFRLTFEKDEVYLGYSLAKEYRGKGLGNKIVQMAIKKARKNSHSATTMIARVKYKNISSNQIFHTLGFLEFPCSEYIEYHMNL